MKKNITTEDKLVSYEANCKQALDPLSPVQLLGPKQTIGPTVPLMDTFTDNKETSGLCKVSLDFLCVFVANSKNDLRLLLICSKIHNQSAHFIVSHRPDSD